MNKAQLIEKVSSQLGSRKAAGDAVEAVVDTITRAVASGEKVAISGFGVFEKVARPARTGRNPRAGETVKIKKTSVPKFKPGQGFKDVVSGAKKLPKAAASAASAARSAAGGDKKAATRSTATKTTPAKKTTAKSTAASSTAKKATTKTTPAKKTTAKSTATKSAKKTTTTPAKKTAKATARKR